MKYPEMLPEAVTDAALMAMESSRPRSGTAVGAAVYTDNWDVYAGCNVELEFRLGLHAEISAFAAMKTADPYAKAKAVVIASQKQRFTPCGGCLDWIMQLGTLECRIICVHPVLGLMFEGSASSLMPWYPKA